MASAIASCVSGLPHVSSKSSDEEKEMFLARVEWLPVTSRSHGQMSQTDKCKISIMMCYCVYSLLQIKHRFDFQIMINYIHIYGVFVAFQAAAWQ